jgi:DNA-directed RNA polymerase specialized sigma24 family protein
VTLHKIKHVEKSPDHERVFLDHYEWLLGWARQLTHGSKHEAEDLVQDLYIRFVQSKADIELTDEDRLRGYLYKTLRHLFISRKLRHGQDALSSLLVVDFDSAAFALSAVDRSRLLFVRSDLATICEYACIRRGSNRGASALIFRFFLGYFPSEIARIFKANRAAVDKLIHGARGEARVYLSKPNSLHFMNQEVPKTRMSKRQHLPDNPVALHIEIRRRLFAEPNGPCLTDAEIEACYDPQSSNRMTTTVLAHLTSCSACLEATSRILGLPGLSHRISSDGSDGGSNGPDHPIDKGRGPNLRRKLRETFEHRPAKLQIAVNGEVRGVQAVTSPHSEVQIKLDAYRPVEFVEVMSEQGVRLLFYSVEEPNILEPAAQKRKVELSDGRTLSLEIALHDGVPTVEVDYFDPLAEDSSIAASTFSVSSVVSSSDPKDTISKKVELWTRLRTWLGRLDWLWIRHVCLASAVGGVLLLLVVLKGTRSNHPVDIGFSQLLQQAALAGEDRIPMGGAIRQTFAFEVRSQKGLLIDSGKIDTLKGRSPDRSATRLFNHSGTLLRGHWRNSKGRQSSYPLRNTQKGQGSEPRGLWSDAWTLVPDATTFAAFTSGHGTLSAKEKEDSYELTYHAQAPPHGDSLLSATLVIARDRLTPIEETLQLRQDNSNREYRFKELTYEVVPSGSVIESDFEIPADLNSAAPSSGLSGIAPTAPARLALQAFQLLENLDAQVQSSVNVDRLPDGRIELNGVLPTSSDRLRVERIFAPLKDNTRFTLALHSADEPAPVTAPSHPINVESLAPVAVDETRIPLDPELRAAFIAKGFSGSELDQHIHDFAREAMDRSAKIHREGWTIRQIAVDDFSPGELQSLEAEERMVWLTLLDKHIRAITQEVTLLELSLRTELGGAGQSSPFKAPANDAPNNLPQLRRIATKLNRDSDRLDRLLTSGLALSAVEPATNDDLSEITQLLAVLRTEESMLHETVVRLQAARP